MRHAPHHLERPLVCLAGLEYLEEQPRAASPRARRTWTVVEGDPEGSTACALVDLIVDKVCVSDYRVVAEVVAKLGGRDVEPLARAHNLKEAWG